MQKYYTFGNRACMTWGDKPRQVTSAPNCLPKNWIIQFLDASGEVCRIAATEPQAVYRAFKKRMREGACTRLQVLTRKAGKLVQVDTKRFFALCNER